MTERLHFHFSLSGIGEGNDNPLQCSCLENPRNREPSGLPSVGLQSRTRLQQLSSSSSSSSSSSRCRQYINTQGRQGPYSGKVHRQQGRERHKQTEKIQQSASSPRQALAPKIKGSEKACSTGIVCFIWKCSYRVHGSSQC